MAIKHAFTSAIEDGVDNTLVQPSDWNADHTGGVLENGWNVADAMTYASADDPTFTVTISGDQSAKYSVGMRIKITQSTGGTKYFIITKIAVSGDTTLTLYGGTDYNLENQAITSPYYSVVKAPQGFPLSPAKWTVQLKDTTVRSQASPTDATWYNLGSLSISIPIGVWKVSYQVTAQLNKNLSSSALLYLKATLSTANNSESDSEFTCSHAVSGYGISNTVFTRTTFYRKKILSLDSKTSYYINTQSETSSVSTIYNNNDSVPLLIDAVCAYL